MIRSQIFITIVAIVLFLFSDSEGFASTKFYQVNSLYGISIREANSVCKDDHGFIWVSSKTGILRLTEDDYRIYQLPYESANVITVKMVYQDSTLWVYTNNGQLFLYNEVFDRFDRVINMSVSLNSVYMSINSILIAPDKKLWISSSSGLYMYSNEQIVSVGEDRTNINRMEWYNQHELILGKGNDIELFDINTKQSHSMSRGNAFTVSSFLMNTQQNVLWIGTVSDGVYFYDFNKSVLKNFPIQALPKQPVLALEFNSDSTLFAGIDGQGIWELDLKAQKVLNIFKENINDPNSLRGNGVYDIFKDLSNRVWVCTYSGGVSYFDQASPLVEQLTHQINNPNSLVNNDVNCVLEDHRGRLWMATNNGVSCWDRSINKWSHFYTNKQAQAQVFLTLCEDNLGRIWAGTYSSGVYVIDGETGLELNHYSSKEANSPITNDFIFDIYNDRNDDIWIGGVNSEVIRYDIRENRFQKYNVQPLYVFADYIDNQMLLGCTYGLSVTDKISGNFSVLIEGFLVEDLWVTDSLIWICTSGHGLISYHPLSNEKKQYNTETGLPSNFINSIIAIDKYFWLGTESGICRFNPVDQSVLTYSSIQSLSTLSFNRNSVCQLNDGQLAWGTNNGVVIFNPNSIHETPHQGKIFIQDLSIAGRSIREIPTFNLSHPVDELNEITLKYNQNTISLELLPIGVSPGSKFSWKLEGFDENWSPPSNNRIVSYTNINSKNLKLKIRLYDSSLSNIIKERVLSIDITPPFWSTWYFFVVVFILITVVIYLSLWYYINLLKQKHTEEKVRFFTNTAHDIRTSLTLIKAPVEELNKETGLSVNGKYFLKLAREQVIRLSSVVTQLMDFQKVDIGRGQLVLRNVDIVNLLENRIMMFESLASSRKVKLEFNSEVKIYETALDETKLEKIVDNLISNAIKYSHEGGSVKVFLKFTETKWSLTVIDEGIGIGKRAQRQLFKEFYRADNAINAKIVGSGIGLLLVKNYLTLMGGDISCDSQENIGSSFQVHMPFKKMVGNEEKVAASMTSSAFLQANEIPSPNKDKAELTSSDMSVLIVEDNDDLRNFLKHALGGVFQVFTADDGKQGWELAQKEMPDLVVSDIMMPNMDGFDLCRIMKSTYETSHIPIILLTSLTGQAEQLQGLGLGADDYLTKPFDIVILQQKISSIIKNRVLVKDKALRLIKQHPEESILLNEHNDQFIKKMLEVVQRNISNAEFNKNSFAAEMNVSGSLLYKKIKALTDQSPSDFIKMVRLDYALTLLRSKTVSVTEVSEQCGFASVGYFSTVFKKNFGKSPTEIE
ncbi:MAG: response regulator [Prolixibacteraceae bacterium]